MEYSELDGIYCSSNDRYPFTSGEAIIEEQIQVNSKLFTPEEIQEMDRMSVMKF